MYQFSFKLIINSFLIGRKEMKQFLKQNDCTFDRGVLRNKINNERAKLQRFKKIV